MNFRRILAFCNSRKWGHSRGVCERLSELWLAGGVGPRNSVSLRKNKGAGIAYFLSKVRIGMVKKASLGGPLKSTKKDPGKL